MGMMETVFQSNLSQMTTDEKIVLALIIGICVCLVFLAFSMVVQVARRHQQNQDYSAVTRKGLRGTLGALRQLDLSQEEPRMSHGD